MNAGQRRGGAAQDGADALLLGRITYQMMASYWPTEEAIKNDPIVAGQMNRSPKIVFSRTLAKADWNNTRLIKDHVAEEIIKLKQQPGKDLLLFGPIVDEKDLLAEADQGRRSGRIPFPDQGCGEDDAGPA